MLRLFIQVCNFPSCVVACSASVINFFIANGRCCFAFVKFDNTDAPARAVHHEVRKGNRGHLYPR